MTSLALPLAAADVAEWLKVVMPAIVIFIYIINYLINENKQSQKRPQRKPVATPPNASQRPVDPRARPGAQPVAGNEIEEFLRRAAQQLKDEPGRKQPSGRPQPQPPSRKQPVARDTRKPTIKPTQRTSQEQPQVRRLVEQPAEVEMEVVDPSNPRESVAEHVSTRLSTDEFSARASHLADDMARADIQREQHLKRVFGHQVGTLQTEKPLANEEKFTSSAPSVTGPAAGGLGGLLHGDALRYAVILNEILARPEDRW